MSVEVRPNWLRVEHSCQQCALSLNVVDTSHARQQVRDLKLMPAREIIVIRGGRSHDTGLVHFSAEEVALFFIIEEVALFSVIEEVTHHSGVCRDMGLPTSTHLLPLTKAQLCLHLWPGLAPWNTFSKWIITKNSRLASSQEFVGFRCHQSSNNSLIHVVAPKTFAEMSMLQKEVSFRNAGYQKYLPLA